MVVGTRLFDHAPGQYYYGELCESLHRWFAQIRIGCSIVCGGTLRVLCFRKCLDLHHFCTTRNAAMVYDYFRWIFLHLIASSNADLSSDRGFAETALGFRFLQGHFQTILSVCHIGDHHDADFAPGCRIS
ncbi:hypothetical protein D3C86_1608800 [compost metagenome]